MVGSESFFLGQVLRQRFFRPTVKVGTKQIALRLVVSLQLK